MRRFAQWGFTIIGVCVWVEGGEVYFVVRSRVSSSVLFPPPLRPSSFSTKAIPLPHLSNVAGSGCVSFQHWESCLIGLLNLRVSLEGRKKGGVIQKKKPQQPTTPVWDKPPLAKEKSSGWPWCQILATIGDPACLEAQSCAPCLGKPLGIPRGACSQVRVLRHCSRKILVLELGGATFHWKDHGASTKPDPSRFGKLGEILSLLSHWWE